MYTNREGVGNSSHYSRERPASPSIGWTRCGRRYHVPFWRVIFSTVDGFLTPGTELGGTLLLRELKMGVTFEYQMSDSGASKFSALTGSSPCSLARSLSRPRPKPNQSHSMFALIHLVLLLFNSSLNSHYSPLDHPSASIESLARG
jgi:hypothetical protein